MSQNIHQIFVTNPASSLVSTDLIYLGRSPYGVADDFAITAANFISSVTAGAVLLAPSGAQTITGFGLTLPSLILGSPLPATSGGTGVANLVGSTLTLAGALTTAGAFASTFTMTAATNVTFPTTGTLATTDGTVASITGTANQVIASAATGAVTLSLPQSIATTSSPTFAALTLTSPLTGANGGTGVANTGLTINLGTATTGFVLTSDVSGNATWAANPGTGSATTLTGDSGSATASAGAITVSGGTTGLTTSGSSHTLSITGVLKLINGGTNAALVASNGGIFYSTASAGAILAGTVTANQLLLSGANTGPIWSTSSYPATNAINTLLYASSTNVMAALATANSAVLTTTSTGVPGWSGTLINGQVIVGSTGATPVAATLTAGAGVSITNGAGTITIASTTADIFWAANASSSFTAVVNNGYILTSGSATTVALPTTFAVGALIGVQGQGAAWTATLGASTNVKAFGNTYTTSLASTNNTDNVVLIGLVANTTWGILSMSNAALTAS